MTVEEKICILSLDFSKIWYFSYLIHPHKLQSKELSKYEGYKTKFEKRFLLDGGQRLQRLMRRSRNIDLIWEIPKGMMNKAESPIQSAIREFYEETGIKKSKYRILWGVKPIEHIFSDEGVTYRYVYYIAEMLDHRFVPMVDPVAPIYMRAAPRACNSASHPANNPVSIASNTRGQTPWPIANATTPSRNDMSSLDSQLTSNSTDMLASTHSMLDGLYCNNSRSHSQSPPKSRYISLQQHTQLRGMYPLASQRDCVGSWSGQHWRSPRENAASAPTIANVFAHRDHSVVNTSLETSNIKFCSLEDIYWLSGKNHPLAGLCRKIIKMFKNERKK
jgi:ADP-ribose pyrophosphatase YjhB (NUDIX family)